MASNDADQFWTVKNFASLLGSEKISTASKDSHSQVNDKTKITGVSIDTRSIKKGEAFIAIEGENFDGHDFIEKAFKKGAVLAITSKLIHSKSGKIIQVDSNIKSGANALYLLAKCWRKYLDSANTLVIAVVGSNGKTTTRRLIHQTLNTAYSYHFKKTLKGTQSPASFNNNLGVALTLLKASAKDDFVVTEIGTNHPGEIAALGNLAKPSIAVITSIGKEHLEHFGDIKAVAKEEANILKTMANRKLIIGNDEAGASFSNISAPAFIEQSGFTLLDKFSLLPENIKAISYTAPKYQSTARGEKITLSNNIKFTLPLFGKHNSTNAGAAIEIGRFFGIEDKTISANLSGANPAPGRFEPIEKNGINFINDCYNANPDSMIESLNTFYRLETKGRKILILGDMLELGDKAASFHEQIGEHILKLSQDRNAIDKLILIGDLAKHIATPLLKQQEKEEIDIYSRWSDNVKNRINSALLKDDLVLIKASRGMKLERII